MEEHRDGVVWRDEDTRSYSKFCPDGKRIRLYFRDPDLADLNLFLPDTETAVLHCRFDPKMIIINAHESHEAPQLILSRNEESEPFKRLNEWKIDDPDRIEAFILKYYADFEERRP